MDLQNRVSDTWGLQGAARGLDLFFAGVWAPLRARESSQKKAWVRDVCLGPDLKRCCQGLADYSSGTAWPECLIGLANGMSPGTLNSPEKMRCRCAFCFSRTPTTSPMMMMDGGFTFRFRAT